MMKRLLSIIMSICMLLTMFVVPAIAEEAQADSGLTHDYYKWDFSEGKLYTDYANPVQPEGATYDFTAVGYNGKYAIDYGKINGVDGLRIRASGDTKNISIVPLKEDGSPFVLEAGKEYVVEWVFSVKRLAKAWSRAHVAPYSTIDGSGVSKTSNPNYAAYYETENEDGSTTLNWLLYANGTLLRVPHRAMYGAPQLQYWDNPAKLTGITETIPTVYNSNTFAASTSASYKGTINENGAKYSFTQTLNMRSDEELAKTYNVTHNTDGSYSFSGTNGDKTYNNFLSLELPGTDNYYAEGENEEALTTTERDGKKYYQMYGEYYITGLTVYEKGVGAVEFHKGDEVHTVTGTDGDTVALDIPEAPEGKYFVGWYSDADFTTLVTSAPTITEGALQKLYARFEDYQNSVTYNYESFTASNANLAYMKDGEYTTSIAEGGWLKTQYTEEGLFYTNNGKATKFDPPATTTATFNEAKGDKYVAYATPGKVGQIYNPVSSWSDANTYTIKDVNGNPFVVKPNTKYVAEMTYVLQGEGNASIALVAGRKISNASATPTASAAYSNFYANSSDNLTFTNLTSSEEPQTHTFTIETGDLADTVPVLGFISMTNCVKVKRIESVTIDDKVYTEWVVGDKTYYPYEFLSRPAFVVKEIKIREVNTVTYNIGAGATVTGVDGTYSNGVFTANYTAGEEIVAPTVTYADGSVVRGWYTDETLSTEATEIVAGGVYYAKTGVPVTLTLHYAVDGDNNPVTEEVKGYAGDALKLPSTKFAMDENWYSSVYGEINKIYNSDVFPSADTNLYSAGYLTDYNDKLGNDASIKYIYAPVYTVVDGDGDKDYELYYDSPESKSNGYLNNAFRLEKVEDHTTYKIEVTYKAMGGNMGFAFTTGSNSNFWGSDTGMHGGITSSLYSINEATDGYVTATMYVTTDLIGTMTKTSADDTKRISGDYLYLNIKDNDETGESDLYIKDCVVTSMGEIVGTIGASKLKDEALEGANGKQAIRYYFNYKTDDGSNLYIGDEKYEVVRRGFLYRNGNMSVGEKVNDTVVYTYDNTNYVDYLGAMKQQTGGMTVRGVGNTVNQFKPASDGALNECWGYDDDSKIMTFSTYVVGYGESMFNEKLMVRGYVTILVDGQEMTIYSKPVNRCVNGIEDTHVIH